MSITSKPQDSDEIVRAQKGPLGGNRLVSTRQLITFFDDLLNDANLKDRVIDELFANKYHWVIDSPKDDSSASAYYGNQTTQTELEIITDTATNETYTAVDNMFIFLKKRARLLLPAQPKRNSVVYMTKDNTLVSVNGNGKAINGVKCDIRYQKNNLSRTYQYFIDADEWRIR